MAPLDLLVIRREFPALDSGFAFFDNAGGSQVLRRVAERIYEYLLNTSVQLGASYAVSERASARVLEARCAIAELIHAPHDEEVVMGPSTTALLGNFTAALRPGIRPGDEIIVTDCDHESNIGCWRRLEEVGAVIRCWQTDRDSLMLEPDDLGHLLNERTRWVAMTCASNVLGSINPVAQIARRVHAAGARLCVDAVAYAPHRLIDVQALGVDACVFSFYKVYGPHQAVFWAPRDLLRSLPVLNHGFIGADDIPYKLQPGNVNFELAWGAAGIADYLVDVGIGLGVKSTRRASMQAAFDAFAAQEDLLTARFLDFLAAKPGVRVIGRTGAVAGLRVPTISFSAAGRHCEPIVRHVDANGIGIRFGDFYARHLIDALGLAPQGGVVRVSMVHYNTIEEVDRLIEALDPVL